CERAAPLAARRQRGALGSALPLARDQGGELLQRPGLRRVPEGLEPLAEDGATAARSSLDLRGPRLPTEEGHVPLVRVARVRPAAQGSLWPTARGEHLPRAIELGTGMKRPEWGRKRRLPANGHFVTRPVTHAVVRMPPPSCAAGSAPPGACGRPRARCRRRFSRPGG